MSQEPRITMLPMSDDLAARLMWVKQYPGAALATIKNLEDKLARVEALLEPECWETKGFSCMENECYTRTDAIREALGLGPPQTVFP